MFNIGKYLERFKTIGVREVEIKEFIQAELVREFSLTIPIEMIIIKDGIVTVKGSAALKSQLFIKKSSLIKKISEQFPTYKIHDIK